MPRTLVLITALVLASELTGCAQINVVAEPTPTAAFLTPEECEALEDSLLNVGRRPRMTPSLAEQFVSLAQAEQRTVFDILLPAYLPEDVTLRCVRLPGVGRSPGTSTVYLIYSDGLTIRQVVARSAALWPLKDLANDGWVQVKVSGAPGIGREPGDVQVIGGTLHNNGLVHWWLEGISYVVTGDLPVEELLRIAESME